MAFKQQQLRPTALALSIGCALAGLGAAPAMAQTATQAQSGAAVQDYAIAPGKLSDVLAQFAAAAGVPLSFDPKALDGVYSSGLQGRYTTASGFASLLAGSGFEAVDAGQQRHVLRRVAPRPSASPGANNAEATLPSVTVTAQSARGDGLPGVYAGGQVARGGHVGLLGNKDVMDTPFSQTNYTNKTIQNQQAQTIQDVLLNDPSILTKQNNASDEDGSISIRGFTTTLGSGAGSLNGLVGMAPLRSPDMDYIERVEVLRGPSALLNGMAASGTSGPGGSYNLVTKQADDEPLTQLTARYGSRSQLGTHLDVGRRFGAKHQFGIRFNGAYRKGDTQVAPTSAEVGVAALNLDYRGERTRLSADIVHQSNDSNPQNVQQLVVNGRSGSVAFVPEAPDTGTSLNPVWSKQPSKLTLGMVRGEVDINDNVTAYAAIGKQKLDFSLIGPNLPKLLDTSGTYGWSNVEHSKFAYDVLSMQGGLRAKATTGSIAHAFSLNLSQSEMEYGEAQATSPFTYTTNIYHPVFGIAPFIADPGDPKKASKSRVSSIGIADTLSIFNERVQFTAGIRHQRVVSDSFDTMTGARTSNYDSHKWTPALALIVKPRENVSLYANYIENLEQGNIVWPGYANSGQVLPPYASKQYEAGIKVDWGTVTTTLAAFQLSQLNAIDVPDPNGGLPTLALNGEVRVRGVELNAYGEFTRGVRMMGGVTLLDSSQTKTQDGLFDGIRDAGIPALRTVVGGEWDTPFLQGLTLTGRFTYTGNQLVTSSNKDLKLPSWTLFDLGARYVLDSPWNNKPITVRFNVDNVFDKNYWSGTNNRYVQLGAPRTYRLSVAFDF